MGGGERRIENQHKKRLLEILAEINDALPEDLWIVEMSPVRITAAEADASKKSSRSRNRNNESEQNVVPLTEGSLKSLTIRGMGYTDKVVSPDYICGARGRGVSP